ncbi:hypothetical protein R3P38DRAFT_3056003, partial [Favolaschia claudopus]
MIRNNELGESAPFHPSTTYFGNSEIGKTVKIVNGFGDGWTSHILLDGGRVFSSWGSRVFLNALLSFKGGMVLVGKFSVMYILLLIAGTRGTAKGGPDLGLLNSAVKLSESLSSVILVLPIFLGMISTSLLMKKSERDRRSWADVEYELSLRREINYLLRLFWWGWPLVCAAVIVQGLITLSWVYRNELEDFARSVISTVSTCARRAWGWVRRVSRSVVSTVSTCARRAWGW